MIEELYGIEKVEEILMHHSYVGVNLEEICPQISTGQHYPRPSLPSPSPTVLPSPLTETTPITPDETDKKIIDVLSLTEAPMETEEESISEKTKKKDKKEEEGKALVNIIKVQF